MLLTVYIFKSYYLLAVIIADCEENAWKALREYPAVANRVIEQSWYIAETAEVTSNVVAYFQDLE